MSGKSRSWLSRWFGPYPGPEPRGKELREGFQWKEFFRDWLKAVPWIIGLTALGHVMGVMGLLKGFESAALDTFLRLETFKLSDRIVIVEITNRDYKELFNETSPLSNEHLIDLAAAVANYHPAAIGMDFDTGSGNWCRLDPEHEAKLQQILPGKAGAEASNRTPVVWAEIPSALREPLQLERVLGGRLQNHGFAGVPRFPIDSDGVVRHYEERFEVEGTLGACDGKPKLIPQSEERRPTIERRSTMPSLASAILAQACRHGFDDCPAETEKTKEAVIFNFYGDRYRFPIIQSHEFIGPDAEAHLSSGDLDDARNAQFSKKIVLIGGNFGAARDVYPTPRGPMAGVELIGLAIESHLKGGIRETHPWHEWMADAIVGSLIVLTFYYYRRRPSFAFNLTLFGLPIMAIIFSVILFRTAAYWFNFMPIIIGMVLHELVELSKSNAELRKLLLEHESESHTRRLKVCAEHFAEGTAGEKKVVSADPLRSPVSAKTSSEPPAEPPDTTA